ncbi:MAG TPA: hypothetical protein VG709_05160, partial [Actinomycetota bacterium]|nr:hypothetical protein [Actinomycetota bacterium]
MHSRLPVFVVVALSLLVVGLGPAEARRNEQVAVRAEPRGIARAGVDASFAESYGTFDWAVVDAADLG